MTDYETFMSMISQSILHGSPEAKEEGDVQIQQHSKLVARGKYVHGFESESVRYSTLHFRYNVQLVRQSTR